MLLGKRIRLYPTEYQEQIFFQFAGTSRFAYNYALGYKLNTYDKDKSNPNQKIIRNALADLKHNDSDYEWLNSVPEAITKKAIADLDSAYTDWLKSISGKSKKKAGKPKFKKKGKCIVSFFQRTDNIHMIDDTHIKITGIKDGVRVKESIPVGVQNTRVKYDGKYWYLTYCVETKLPTTLNTDKTIGVDLGIKEAAIISDGTFYENINKSKSVKNLEKRKRHLQRQLSRKYEANKQGNKFVKTNNIKKLEQQIRLIDRTLSNIRHNYIHNITKDLVKTTPKTIVIEDLNVSGMMKNKHLSKAVQQQLFYEFRRQLEYKCKIYGIELIVADRFYPSSKLCSCCGNKKTDLKLKDRIYKCDCCGLVIDRDLNAAINLSFYPQFIERNKTKNKIA